VYDRDTEEIVLQLSDTLTREILDQATPLVR